MIVVVIPYVALAMDVCRCLDFMHILCAAYHVTDRPDPAQTHVVLVSIKSAATDAFIAWLSGAQASKFLCCVVVDKVYLTESNFWEPFHHLYKIVQTGCQRICLTGMLSPRSYTGLLEASPWTPP